MQVDCPSCRLQIHSDDINLTNMVAKCRRCHSLVSLNRFLNASGSGEAPFRPVNRQKVPQPPGFTVDESGPGLKVIRRWYSGAFVFLAFFCIGWDSFLVIWYFMAFAVNAPWLFKVFPVIHVAVGVCLTYYTLAGFLNSTTISVEGMSFRVRHGPLPWFRNMTLQTDHIDQLYAQQETHQRKNGVSYSYKVCAVTREGHKVVLVPGLE